MEGAKWKSTVLEISMNWWQLEFHPTEFQFYRINSGYGVVRTLFLTAPVSRMAALPSRTLGGHSGQQDWGAA